MASRSEPSVATGWRRWPGTHPYTVAAFAALCVLAVPFLRREDSEWEQVFVRAAAHLAGGEDIYNGRDGYLYPPFMAWAALPFTHLGHTPLRIAWLLVNAACLVLLLGAAWRLAGGGPLQGNPPAPRGEHMAAILGVLGGLCYLQNCLAHQQTDVVIAALLLGGCLLLARARGLLAATCFGVAAACKCTALLWAPYLVWRRRPLAAAWLLAVAFGVNFLPELVSASPSGRTWLADYGSRFLRPLTASDRYASSWGSDPIYNQSLGGTVQRWCTTTCNWHEADCPIDSRPNPASPGILRLLVYGLELALVGVVLWTCGRPFRTVEPEAGEAVSRQALEFSLVLALMLLLSPMSSKAHFGTLVLPGFCLARAAFHTRNRALWGVLLAATVCAVLSNKDPLGERLYSVVLWAGSVTSHTLLLLAGCLLVLRRQKVGHSAGDESAPLARAA